LISLFSYVGETVLDPFLGSGTTVKVARELRRNSWGYEIDLELRRVIEEKVGVARTVSTRAKDTVDFIERVDAKRLRAFLQSKVKMQRSVTRKK